MNIKKILAGAMAFSMIGGTLPFDNVIPENIVAPFTASADDSDSYTAYVEDILNNYTINEIEASEIKPRIHVESKVISTDEIFQKQTINISVEGANLKYCSTGLHIYYDKRLTLCTNRLGEPDVAIGKAIEILSAGKPKIDPSAVEQDMNGVFVATAGDEDKGKDGIMWTLTFELPYDASAGDVYPIDIIYKSNENANDLFTNKPNNAKGKLMQAYTFTKGIYNVVTNYNFTAPAEDIEKVSALAYIDRGYDGYIAVEDERQTTTTTTTTTTTKPTTTTTTTTTTKPTTTTTTTTTTKPTTTTTTTTTTKSTTTTTTTTTKIIGEEQYIAEIIDKYTMKEIDSSEIKPHIYIDSKVISADEISDKQTINIMVNGAEQKYASTSLYIYYDSRLTLCKNKVGLPDAEAGDAIKYLTHSALLDPKVSEQNMSGILLATAEAGDYGMDGVMWTLTFELPKDATAGDVYPIDIFYKTSNIFGSVFTNSKDDSTGKLMDAYTFTKGIYNTVTNYNFTASDEDITKVPALADIDKSYDGYIAVSVENNDTLPGDANCDGEVNIADAAAIIQYLGNRDKYGLSEQGLKNADCCNVGDGVTGLDALALQRLEAKIITKLPDTNK